MILHEKQRILQHAIRQGKLTYPCNYTPFCVFLLKFGKNDRSKRKY